MISVSDVREMVGRRGGAEEYGADRDLGTGCTVLHYRGREIGRLSARAELLGRGFVVTEVSRIISQHKADMALDEKIRKAVRATLALRRKAAPVFRQPQQRRTW